MMSVACMPVFRIVSTTLMVLVTFLFISLQFKDSSPKAFDQPPNQKFYAKSHLTLLEKLAGYWAQQNEQEESCQFQGGNQSCTFELLNEYHHQCGYFSTQTSWENITDGFPFAKVVSDTCVLPKIKNMSEPSTDLHNYVRTHNISHIVLFGDSQGHRYNFALKAIFKDAGFTCKILKYERKGVLFGLEYFIDDVDPSLLLPVNRTCPACSSMLSNCTDSADHSVLVEYISMIMNSKATVLSEQSFCQDKRRHPLCTTTSQQEYVFKHYFNRGTYPQLILMFTTFVHDRERAFVGLDQGMRHLLEMIDSHVPSTSTIIWYTTTPFHEDKMYPDLRNMIAENGYHVNQKIDVLNHLLFHLLQPQLEPQAHRPSMYGFFDMYHLQEGLNQTWAQDWVHSQPSWYQYILGYTLRMLAEL